MKRKGPQNNTARPARRGPQTRQIRVAIYARVSSRGDRQEPENQLAQLRSFAKAQGWKITREYVDHVSGTQVLPACKAQNEMFNDASQHQFDRVLVWALDRLSRGNISEVFNRIERLKQTGIDLWSFTEEHFRTTGPAGSLLIAVSAWVAAQEVTRLSDRIHAGLSRAREQGIRLGRPPKSRYPAEQLKELKEQGYSVLKIAEETGLSRATIYARLNQPSAGKPHAA